MNWYDDFPHAVQQNVPLAKYTWFNLGGAARYFIEPSDVAELQAILVRLRENEIPIFVLGGGANLLIRDAGVDGAVIRLAGDAFKTVQTEGNRVTAGAGKDVQKLILESATAGLGGLECLAGIPGTVGGEVKMNAGGAYGDIGSSVVGVTVMDTGGAIVTRTRDDLVFSYRKSNISAKFILDATFELVEDDAATLTAKYKEIWMWKKNSQPLRENSAGCIFKNPNGESAGKLIDQAGLKGLKVGLAEVSERHANFIVAPKGSSASEVLTLIEQVRTRVRDKFGVQLETEVAIW
jgi:UDP-N-acetylmuramate dehydrogenase